LLLFLRCRADVLAFPALSVLAPALLGSLLLVASSLRVSNSSPSPALLWPDAQSCQASCLHFARPHKLSCWRSDEQMELLANAEMSVPTAPSSLLAMTIRKAAEGRPQRLEQMVRVSSPL